MPVLLAANANRSGQNESASTHITDQRPPDNVGSSNQTKSMVGWLNFPRGKFSSSDVSLCFLVCSEYIRIWYLFLTGHINWSLGSFLGPSFGRRIWSCNLWFGCKTLASPCGCCDTCVTLQQHPHPNTLQIEACTSVCCQTRPLLVMSKELKKVYSGC